ncbi:MAG: cobalt-precorrin-5B (C(1))-methyltransferase CbiD [Desulfobacterota bacterium]|nr:cobalt-precorrin-5B (C(1))-methyltransferase CbiD [Thermodesulfobacteriota bacterium]
MSGLRKGYTTGTCAQAAAKAAGLMLATGKKVESVEVETPSGLKLRLPIIDPALGEGFARCGIVKDAGDDPDVTHGTKIYAEVRFVEGRGVTIKGGEGVGIVTRPGLAVPVGQHAINPTPRKMILRELSEIFSEGRGLEVIITVPDGESLARRTFNPQLGIVGGISILGTTGIVEPKSIDAYKTSLSLRLDVLRAEGERKATLVLGYVGERYCREILGLSGESFIKIGDHVGFMLEECSKKGFEEVLLIGHIGKLVKVAAGQFDTHFRFGDRRMETIAHYAKLKGASPDVVEAILREKTAEAKIPILKEAALTRVFQEVALEVVRRIKGLLERDLLIECILLSLEGEVLGRHRE